jgi:uncharacterized RDD family membrane protein YckC
MELLDTTADVETPERVRFRYRLAGAGPRAVAWGIDFAIRLAVFIGFILVLSMFATIPGLDGVSTGLMLVFLFLLEWFYGVFFETVMAGRTPGKLVLSLRVVRVDGSPGRFPDFLLRNLLRGVAFLPILFGVGLVAMLLDDRVRRVGAVVAGTVVVCEDRSAVLSGVAIHPPVTEEERRELPGRVDLDRDELAIIEEYLRRRRRLSDERAEELAWLLGPAISERTGVQADTWERVLTLAYARATGKDREAEA